MESLEVLKAHAVINRLIIALSDAAHQNYMGRTTWKEYEEAVYKGRFEACCDLENIIEKMEEELEERDAIIETLKKGRKKTHEEITIVNCN